MDRGEGKCNEKEEWACLNAFQLTMPSATSSEMLRSVQDTVCGKEKLVKPSAVRCIVMLCRRSCLWNMFMTKIGMSIGTPEVP